MELKNTPTLEPGGKTYTFEGEVSGYYSDPTPVSLRNDKLHKASFTHSTNQYFYADITPRLERVLGSSSLHATTKLFVDGDYRFPVEETSTPGYIEVRGVSFNATNRTSLSCNPATASGATGGSGGKRRNVLLKASPVKPKYTGGSSQASPERSRAATANVTTDYEASSMSFALADFGNDPEVSSKGNPSNIQNKRGLDNTGAPETPKRQRRPTAKAKEREEDMS